jgi:hypothetical protein
MLLNRVLLCICFLFSFISYKSLSAPVSDGMCILLKQQVQQFSHAKQSRNYRQAKRAYDQGCYRANTNKTATQVKSTKLDSAKVVPVVIDPVEVVPVEVVPVEVIPVNEVPVEVTPIEVEPVEVEVVPVEVKPIVKKAAPELTSNPAKNNVNNNSLLEAYLMPTLVLVGVLLFVIFFVFYIKPRAGKLKNSIEAIKSKAEDIKTEQAEKKKNKEKSVIKSPSKKRLVAKKRKKDELDKDIYKSFKQLVLRLENNELVKVERITVSPYGIFVIESQIQSGGIFGGLNSDKWTSKTGDKTLEFDNPIKDVKQKSVALAKFLEVKIEIQLVVLFDDETEFKAPMPGAVMHRSKLNTYIKSFKELVLSDDDFEDYTQLINDKVTADWNKSQNNDLPEDLLKSVALTNNVEEKSKVTPTADEEQEINQTSNKNLSDEVKNTPDLPEQADAKPLSLEETLNELYKNEAHLATDHVEEPQDSNVEETVENIPEINKTDNTVEEVLTELPTQDEFLASLEMPELSNEKENAEAFENNDVKEPIPSESDSILAEIEQAKKELDAYLDEADSKPQSSIEAVSDDIIEQLDSIAQGQNELPEVDNNIARVDDVLTSNLESESSSEPDLEQVSEVTHEVDIQSVDDLNQADDMLASYLEAESSSEPDLEQVSEVTHEVDIQSADDLKQADDALASYLESELDDSHTLSNSDSDEAGLVESIEVDIQSADDLKQADDALASYLESELDDSHTLSNDVSDEAGLVESVEVDIQSADDFKQADDALASYLESELESSNGLSDEMPQEIEMQSADDIKQEEKSHKVREGSDLFSNLSLDPTWAADSTEAPKNPTLDNTDKSLKVENKSDASSLFNITLDESWDEKPKD